MTDKAFEDQVQAILRHDAERLAAAQLACAERIVAIARELADLEAQEPDLVTKAHAARAKGIAAQEAIRAAERAANLIAREAGQFRNALRSIAEQRRALEREREALLRGGEEDEAHRRAPIVRSLPHSHAPR